MALFERVFASTPYFHHGAHVNLIEGREHGRGMLSLHQALGNGLATTREAHTLFTPVRHRLRHRNWRGHNRGRRSTRRRLWYRRRHRWRRSNRSSRRRGCWLLLGGGTLLQVAKDILSGYAPMGTAAFHL